MSWFTVGCVFVALGCIAGAEHLVLNGRKISTTNNQGSLSSLLLHRQVHLKGPDSTFKQMAERISYAQPPFPSPSDRMKTQLFINRQQFSPLNPGDNVGSDMTTWTSYPTSTPVGTYETDQWETSTSCPTSTPVGTYETDRWETSTSYPTSTPVGTYETYQWETSTSYPTSTPVGTYETDQWTTSTSYPTSTPVGTYETDQWTTSTSYPTSTPVGTYETDQWTTSTSFPTSTLEATTPVEVCEDVFVFCKFLLKILYGINLETFCEWYGEDCCETCSEEKCVDVGYNGRSCKTLRREFDGDVRELCKYYEVECCETCSSKGESDEDEEDSDEEKGEKGNHH